MVANARVQTASANAREQQNHMVIKNLVITNANLQNCNVFIQGTSAEGNTRSDLK